MFPVILGAVGDTNAVPFTSNPPNDISQFLTWLLHLAPGPALLLGLVFLGRIIKMSPLNNRYIVLILPLVGTILFPFLLKGTGTYSFKAMDFLYGFLIGCTSIWGNQFVRQMGPILAKIFTGADDGQTSFLINKVDPPKPPDGQQPPSPPGPTEPPKDD